MTTMGLSTGACRKLRAAIFIAALWIPQPASAQWGNSIFGPPVPPASIPSVPTPPPSASRHPAAAAASPVRARMRPPRCSRRPTRRPCKPFRRARCRSCWARVRPRAAGDHRRPGVADLFRQAGPERHVQAGEGRKVGSPTLVLPAGGYVVHVSFGLASAVSRCNCARKPCARFSRSRRAGCGSKPG